MKSLIKLSIAFSALIILFSSCGKNNEVGKMIPGNALFVTQLNIKSLDSKLSWNDVKQTSWYQKAYSNDSTPDWRKKILDNPSASGIDFDNGLIFFVSKSGEKDYYLTAEGAIKNEKDFEQFNKNFDPSQQVRKEGDINLLTLKDKNVVGWNGKYFAYVMNPETTYSKISNWKDSSNVQPSTPVDNSVELSAFCQKLFSLKSDSSLANNDKFSNLLKEDGDIHVWQNNESIINSNPSMGMLGMLKLDAFIKDNISTYTINFDKGKIDVNQKGYVTKELSDVLKKYMGKSINMDMIKNIPSQNVFGLLTFNFKPEGLKELIKLTGADGMVNSYSQQLGFNLDDISKATNGDFLLAFTDLKMNKSLFNNNSDSTNNSGKINAPDFNYIFSVGVGDKASLQKIIDAVTKMGSQMGKDSLANKYVLNDKTFAFGSSAPFVNQYLAGNNNKYDFTDKFSGHPAGFFLDIHKILSEFSNTESSNADDKALLDQSLNMWNNITGYGGDFESNAFTFHTEINLINKDTNSLKQLNNYFDTIYKIHEKKESNNHRLDSLLVPPPIDTVKVK